MTSAIGIKKIKHLNGTNALTVNTAGVITFDQKLVSASTDSSTFAGKIMANKGITAYGNSPTGVDAPILITDENSNQVTFGLTNAGHLAVRNYNSNADIYFSDDSNNVNLRIHNEGYVISEYQPSFSATITSNYTRAGNDTPIDPSWTVNHNIGNHFDATASTFTAPVAGRYFYAHNINHTFAGTSNTGDAWAVKLQVNGSDYANQQGFYGDGGIESGVEGTHNWSGVIELAANDVVRLNTSGTSGTTITFFTGSIWSMHLLG